MDKKTLNNEIILCRAAVRKAKVAVIRKILKKMKILKTCKVEGVKEKKLRKSERLFKKVQIMKKVKLDEVTKFALRNKDLEPFLKGPKVDLKKKAIACLAQHDAVGKKVNSIRERIPNWEVELSLLLDTLGRKKGKKVDSKKELNKSTKSTSKHDEKMIEKGKKVVEKDEGSRVKEKVKNIEGHSKERKTIPGRTKIKNNTDESEISEESDNSMDSVSNSSEKVEQTEKIVDPFFIGKTVIAPKLALESLSQRKSQDRTGKSGKNSLQREANFSGFHSTQFHSKPYKSKKDSGRPQFKPQVPTKVSEEENLHPSWAAKKVKLIKPFQGKKIKFSDD